MWKQVMENIYKGKCKVLAPLVGGSDLSFRLLARKYGADVTFTEMCIAEYYLNKNPKIKLKKYTYEFDETDRPLILQLAGNTAAPIIELANDPMFDGKIDGVDLNCGCPQGFAMDKVYGCALLNHPDQLVALCKEIAENIKYPLSVKLRLHENVDHTIGIMKRLHDVGVQAFAVHGRYWWQKGEKRGLADWDAIKKIRQTFPNIPIIGNGNIGQHEDFERMIQETGVDAVMAGYGALVKPSIFQDKDVPINEYIESYLNIARTRKNNWVDVQRHIQWLVKNYSITALQKSMLFRCQDLSELTQFLAGLEPPIHIQLAPMDEKDDKIEYPKKKMEGLTAKQIKALEKRNQKQQEAHAHKPKFAQSTVSTTTTVSIDNITQPSSVIQEEELLESASKKSKVEVDQ